MSWLVVRPRQDRPRYLEYSGVDPKLEHFCNGGLDTEGRAHPPPVPRLGSAPGSNEPGGPRRRKQSRVPHRSRRQPTPLPGLRCETRLARRASPPRRPTPAVRSAGGVGAHPPGTRCTRPSAARGTACVFPRSIPCPCPAHKQGAGRWPRPKHQCAVHARRGQAQFQRPASVTRS
jgi:hypothetical protein